MAGINERPSKIRKLDVLQARESNPEFSTARDEAPNSTKRFYSEPTDRASEQAEDGQTQTEEAPKLSKSALKKLQKAEAWAAGKDYRKTKRREKHKEKQARKAEERAELQQKIANGEIVPPEPVENRKPKQPARPIQVPVALIMDCDFNGLMTEKEIISLGAQLTRCYSENKSAAYRTHFVISSWGGVLKSRFENVLANTQLQWKGVRFYDEDFESAANLEDTFMRAPSGGKLVGALKREIMQESINLGNDPAIATTKPIKVSVDQESTLLEDKAVNIKDTTGFKSKTIIFSQSAPLPGQLQPKDNSIQSSHPPATDSAPSIIYLTSDSPHTLTELSPYTSYIIGGIVDKNRHKGICYKRARERGIPTAKLPIGEYMTMQSRSVLAINHVVEIMLKWLETGDWGEAFLSVIPKRKEAKLRQKKGENRTDRDDNIREEFKRDDDDGIDEDEDEYRVSLLESAKGLENRSGY